MLFSFKDINILGPTPEPELEQAHVTAFVQAQDLKGTHMQVTIPDPEHSQQQLSLMLKSQKSSYTIFSFRVAAC